MADDRSLVARTLTFARALAWYPCLLAIAWLLQIATAWELDASATYRPIVVLVSAAVIVTVLVRLTVPHQQVAGAIAAMIVLGVLNGDSYPGLAICATAVALLFIEHRMERSGRLHLPWPRIHEAATVVAVVLVVIQAAWFGQRITNRPRPIPQAAWLAASAQTIERPNIYIVIADGHARPDVLASAYGYDARPFLTKLAGLGFEVATSSRANYLDTEQSLPSFMSGAHLTQLGLKLNEKPDPKFLFSALANNPASDLLSRLGYRTFGIASGYDHLGERSMDVEVDTGQVSFAEFRLLQSTTIDLWASNEITRVWARGLATRTIDSLSALEELSQSALSEPRAVVVHLPLPHPPIVLRDDCTPREEDSLSYPPHIFGPSIDPSSQYIRDEMGAYAAQTRCVDTLLVRTLEHVVQADPSAVVVLLSDHGPDIRLDWKSMAQPGLGDRVANLFAARTPGHEGLFSDDQTLVNVLPKLFNAYFGLDLPQQPDDVFIAHAELGGALRRLESTSLSESP